MQHRCFRLVVTAIRIAIMIPAAGCKEAPDVTDPELAPSPEGFLREPDGCPPLESTLPVLPLPWNRRIETFIPPGIAVPAFAVDYDVVPLARVEALTFTYDFDPRTQPVPSETVAHCPSNIEAATWMPADATDDVVRVRVGAMDAAKDGRSGDVFVSVGARTIDLALAGVNLSSSMAEEHWYVVFEPAWGTPRIALMKVRDTSATTLSVPGLPTGPGRLALIQTASIAEQDGSALLHAPSGFAGDFSAFTRGWYQTMIIPSVADAVPPLTRVLPPDVTPKFVSLGEPIAWTPGDGPLVVSVPSTNATGTVSLPCGTVATIVVTGFADVTLSANGGANIALPIGVVTAPSTNCSGAPQMTWTLTTSSLNGRGFDVVVRKGAP